MYSRNDKGKLLNSTQRLWGIVFLIKTNLGKINPFFDLLEHLYKPKSNDPESVLIHLLFSDLNLPAEVTAPLTSSPRKPSNRSPSAPTNPQTPISRPSTPRCSRSSKGPRPISRSLQSPSLKYTPASQSFRWLQNQALFPVEELRFEDLSPLDQQYSGFRPLMLTPLPIELGVQEDEVPLFNQGHLAATAGFRLDHVPARNRTRRLRQDCGFSHQERSDCQPDRQREYAENDQGTFLFEALIDNIELLVKNDLFLECFTGLIEKENEELVSFIMILLQEKHNPEFCRRLLH
jgi:hypothetical protein